MLWGTKMKAEEVSQCGIREHLLRLSLATEERYQLQSGKRKARVTLKLWQREIRHTNTLAVSLDDTKWNSERIQTKVFRAMWITIQPLVSVKFSWDLSTHKKIKLALDNWWNTVGFAYTMHVTAFISKEGTLRREGTQIYNDFMIVLSSLHMFLLYFTGSRKDIVPSINRKGDLHEQSIYDSGYGLKPHEHPPWSV